MADTETDNDLKTQEDPAPEKEQNPEVDEPKEPKKKIKRHLIHPTWLRRTLKTLACIVVFIILIPVLVYVPPVQDLLVKIAEKEVKKSTGMDVSIGHFRLKFPLDVSLQNVSVVEASGDTMISAKEALVDVKLLPLLKLDVDVNKLQLDQAYYRLVDKDTAMIMTIRAGFLEVDDKSSVDIKQSNIDINKTVIRDASIQMYTDVWKKKPSPEDTTSTPFKIRIGDLQGERIKFGMSSLPSIDTLAIFADRLSLKSGLINLQTSKITADQLIADTGGFTFLTPTPEYIKSHPAPVDTTKSSSPPMVIEGKYVSISNFSGLYGVAGAKPKPGFDPSYLQLSGVSVTLNNFYNEASVLRLPISRLEATERCGLKITEGSGFVALDSTGIMLDSLKVRTPYSRLNVTADLPFALLELKPDAPVDINADLEIGLPDVTAFMPDLKKYTKFIKTPKPVNLTIRARGSLKDVDVPVFDLAVPSILSLRASGQARNPLDFKNLAANLKINGQLTDPSIVENFTGNMGFWLPAMRIDGEASVDRNNYRADLAVLTSKGDIAAKGSVNLNSEEYNVHAVIKDFNAGYFVPNLGLGTVSATLDATGDGFNPLQPRAKSDVKLNVNNIEYQDIKLSDLILVATLDHNPNTGKARTITNNLNVDLDLQVGKMAYNNINLQNLKLGAKLTDVQYDGKINASLAGGNVDLTVGSASYDGVQVNNLDLSANLHNFNYDGNIKNSLRNPDVGMNLNLGNVAFGQLNLHDIQLGATLDDHLYDVNFNSPNNNFNIGLALNGALYPDNYSANGYINCVDVNLMNLGLDTENNGGSFDIGINGSAQPDKWLYDVDLDIRNFNWIMGTDTIDLPDGVHAYLLATTDSVSANIQCEDTHVMFDSPSGLKNLIAKFNDVVPTVTQLVDKRELRMDTLQAMLPKFYLSVYTPGKGIIDQFLSKRGIQLDSVAVDLSNDSIFSGFADVWGLQTEKLNIDTLTLDLAQRNYLLDYKVHIGNQPGTMDEFHNVDLSGYVGGNRLSAFLNQENLAGETGYKLGFTAALADSIATLHFTPLKAMIAYTPWTFNADNYVDVNLNNYKIEASLEGSSEESSILLETRVGADDQQELHLKLTDIQVQDFLNMSVTAPPLTATVNSDIRARYNGKELVGVGKINVTGFTYDNTQVDDVNLSMQAAMNLDGTYDASVSLAVENHDALTVATKLVSGDEGLQPEFVKLNLNDFPLSAVNPFLGNDVAQLKGSVSGDMDLSGGFTTPLLNGDLHCDSVSVFLPIMGSSLKFDNEPLTVKDNVIKFNNFDIYGSNNNPLTINGMVDATRLNDIYLDISANANNFQLVGNDSRAGSDIYGKLFLNFSATAKGPMTRFEADANLNILGSTDVTYSIPDANTAIQAEKTTDVVRFVNFADTTTFHPEAKQEEVFMKVQAAVSITPGAQVTVILSPNGTDRVQINPSGSVNLYRNYMGDITLNGQINTGNGFARYNVPVIGTKEFVFDPASYVAWSGPLMNPSLHIKATDTMKVSVSQNGGNSQLVNFLVIANINGTLSAPSILFDLSTEDDMTIENQLQGMSADQRNSAAMNLLITGQYSAGGISSNAGPLTGNVYNFLAQQLNSWAAKNIRGVDLSFGVNQYDMNTDGHSSTATSYSYQLSKSLFNNRFKISVGGNYSTDDSTDDNLTENLISDISFEYILRQSNTQSMLVKLFRHNGYESILEGEIVEMGAGFVYRRKLGDFKSFFDTRRRKRNALNINMPMLPADSDSIAPLPATNKK